MGKQRGSSTTGPEPRALGAAFARELQAGFDAVNLNVTAAGQALTTMQERPARRFKALKVGS